MVYVSSPLSIPSTATLLHSSLSHKNEYAHYATSNTLTLQGYLHGLSVFLLYRVVGIDSLLQALGAGEGDQSVAAQQLRAEIQRLEQQDAELLDYDEQEEDEEDEMVSVSIHVVAMLTVSINVLTFAKIDS